MRYIINDKKYNFKSAFDTETGAYVRTGVLDENGKDTGVDPFMALSPHLIDVGIMGHCIQKVVIHQGTKAIAEFAFCDRRNLREIILSDGIVSIGAHAFESCINLTLITIPESVTQIGRNAFYRCKRLTVKAPVGSYAEQYAKKNNIPFVAE